MLGLENWPQSTNLHFQVSPRSLINVYQMDSPINCQASATMESSPNAILSDLGPVITPQFAADTRDAVPTAEPLAPTPAINRLTRPNIVRNVNVNGTNARTITEDSDTVMAHDVGAPGDIVPTPVKEMNKWIDADY
ncbi:hypothetical protein PSHT_14715 [Puccinia striiformis]|uniref:Uncharacterized protein n=1 Tax=Puccinia striiformis TaxID=27350 RepID=A0A2S4UIT4_9BASI|nr:hypothetical protein PSHT_14715 [Puccinia striiformis]